MLLWRAVSPFSPSTYSTSMPQGFAAPSACPASRLQAIATNLHGLYKQGSAFLDIAYPIT